MYKNKNTTFTIITIVMLMMLTFSVIPAGATEPPVSNEYSPASAGTGATTTILVFDTSGSMGEADISGVTKMQAAVSAGSSILAVIDAENSANLGTQNEIGVVDFDSGASIAANLTTNTNDIQNALNSLSDGGGTALPSGLELGLGLASKAAAGSSPIIILLSDGMPTRGLNGEGSESVIRQQAYDLATAAGSQGICVYTIGFGVPGNGGSIDEAFLQEIASLSGCGKYYNAQSASDLENVYILSRHEFIGDLLFQGQGQIAQGQELLIATVDVPANQESLLYTLQWQGSQIDPTMFDPTGRLVDVNYPGASFTRGQNLATIIVQDPIAGQWQLGAIGPNVPSGTLTYHAALSARQATIIPPAAIVPPAPVPAPGHTYRDLNSGSLGILPFMVFIVLFGAVLIFYAKNKKSKSSAYLRVVNDPANARRIPLKDNFVIGRGSGSSLRLSDTTTSRQHARFNYRSGAWFIQDLGSAGGTFVNGQRIQSRQLNNGDQIKIGQASFSFQTQ